MNTELYELSLKAHNLHLNGEHDQAIALYTQILSQSTVYEVMISKIAALTDLQNTDSALKLSEEAIQQDPSRYEAYLRRGILRFYLGQLQLASDDLKTALQKTESKSAQTNIKRWLNKCGAELTNKHFKSSQVVTPPLQQQVQQPAQQAPVVIQKPSQVVQQQKPQENINQQVLNSSGKIAYTWYQTAKKVGVEINHSLSSKNDLKTHFDEQKIEVSFPLGEGRDYDLSIELFDKINKENVEVKVLLNKIEIIMEKAKPDVSWKTLNMQEAPLVIEEKQTEKKAEDKPTGQKEVGPKKIQVVEQQKPSYPTSSLKKKNWEKIDLEIEEDIKKNKDEYGADPMNDIFKQIYENADENTRRAMIKSYQTSGGTVLSTNWDEVKSKDYQGKDRPEPPKGQEYRKWEK